MEMEIDEEDTNVINKMVKERDFEGIRLFVKKLEITKDKLLLFSGSTPLYVAWSMCDYCLIDFIISCGINPNSVEYFDGEVRDANLLTWMVSSRDEEGIRLMLSRGADWRAAFDVVVMDDSVYLFNVFMEFIDKEEVLRFKPIDFDYLDVFEYAKDICQAVHVLERLEALRPS